MDSIVIDKGETDLGIGDAFALQHGADQLAHESAVDGNSLLRAGDRNFAHDIPSHQRTGSAGTGICCPWPSAESTRTWPRSSTSTRADITTGVSPRISFAKAM